MKKICFVTTTSITLVTFVIPTAVMLHKEGYEVAFICSRDEKFAEMLPEYIKYIPVDMKRGVNLDVFKCIKKMEAIFKKESFDLVQYSTPNASLYASIAAKKANIPIRLYCQWGIRYVGFTGIKRHIFRIIEKIVCTNSTDVRAVSMKNREFAVREKLYKQDKVKVLGQGGTIGVDLGEYDIENKVEYSNNIREKYNLGEKYVFGFVGRFSGDKGSNELLEAFKRIGETNCILLCVGPLEIDSSVDNELYEWATSSPNVIFTGYVDNKELKRYYAAMDCYVHPTYREGFGMVLQEAAAMGCPIITTDIPGASEVMEQNVSCLLVQPRDAESLYRRMKEIMSDEMKSKEMGQEARNRVETYFRREIMLENQKKDYGELLR